MGSGYRVFTAGEVLTASNVQNYLQDQAVMVFAGTAARTSAIGTANFEEGMLTYLTDVDKLQVYTGSSFADVYPPAATSQGLTLINTTSFSGVASQSFNDVFSATYTNYLINAEITADTFRQINLRWRVAGSDNSSATYNYQNLYASGTTVATARTTGQTSFLFGFTDSNGRSGFAVNVFNPFATQRTATIGQSNLFSSTALENFNLTTSFDATTSFTGFSLIASAGNITGSVRVYGYNN
jgi:hypothetical protein